MPSPFRNDVDGTTGASFPAVEKGGDGMLSIIRDNIRNFMDVTVILTMIAIGIFAIFVDYRYFKKVKFQKDAAVSLGVGLACILLPFALLLITRL